MISLQDIEKLAQLSRIHLSTEEKEGLRGQIDSILTYVGQINQVAGTVGNVVETVAPRNVFRDDINPHESGAHTEDLLNEAPQREGQFFKVKKIL